MQHCLITASRRTANANGDTEAAALMFGSLYFILIKYQSVTFNASGATKIDRLNEPASTRRKKKKHYFSKQCLHNLPQLSNLVLYAL